MEKRHLTGKQPTKPDLSHHVSNASHRPASLSNRRDSRIIHSSSKFRFPQKDQHTSDRNRHQRSMQSDVQSVDYSAVFRRDSIGRHDPNGMRRESIELRNWDRRDSVTSRQTERRDSIDSRQFDYLRHPDHRRESIDIRNLDSRRHSLIVRDGSVGVVKKEHFRPQADSGPRMMDPREIREHNLDLARRGSVIPQEVIDARRRSSMNPPALELLRRGSIRPDDSYNLRRETIDGGAVKEIMDYLKTKGLDKIMSPEDVCSTISAGHTSLTTLMSLIEPSETNPNDPHSYSRCDSVHVERIIFHWNIDFNNEVITGDVSLDIRRRKEGTTFVSLDTYELDISNVTVNGERAPYVMYAKKGYFGTKMDVELPDSTNDIYVLRIEYHTSPEATGLSWIPANEAEGRPFPFVFSKCSSIQCRSILPIQDTPSNKIPFVARIKAPTSLKVLMSAPREKQFVMGADGFSTHFFRQEVPVATIYISFVAGHIAPLKLGERITLWADPDAVERLGREFVGIEEILYLAESMCGDYKWKHLDIVVLPPNDLSVSALQNPSLVLVNPTLLTGDRCAAHHMAHELAHSWLGNMVTPANYEHLWLSEGMATYVARKIIGKKYGMEMRLFSASRGLKELQMVVDIYGASHPLTCLVADLSEREPREAILTIPYEKGHTLLYYLELLTEDPLEMEQYIKEYIATFRKRSVTSSMFREHFLEFFKQRHSIKKVDWNAWFNSPGLPPVIPDYHTSLEDVCTTLVQLWLKWERQDTCPFSSNDLNSLNSMQILEVLDQLLDADRLPIFKLESMEKLYHFEKHKNRFIVLKWYLLCLKGHWEDKVDTALHFVQMDGRQLFLLAVYRALNDWDEMREEAIFYFLHARAAMSHNTLKLVAASLRLDPVDESIRSDHPTRKKGPVTTQPPRTDDQISVGTTRRRSSGGSQVDDASVMLNIRRRTLVVHPRRTSSSSVQTQTHVHLQAPPLPHTPAPPPHSAPPSHPPPHAPPHPHPPPAHHPPARQSVTPSPSAVARGDVNTPTATPPRRSSVASARQSRPPSKS